MKKHITIIIAILITIFQIYLISLQPINTKVASTYDDVLMIEQASSILKGNWLGDYNCLTLVKGPFTPIFMAVANACNIPFLIAQDIFYIIACVFLLYVFKDMIKSNTLKIIALVLLIFNPIIYSTELCRAYRDGIYLSLIIYLIAFSFAVFLNKKETITKIIWYYIGLGFTLGSIFLCREEFIWLIPYLTIFAITTIIYTIKDKNILQKKQRILLFIIPIIIATLMVIVVMCLNYRYYGVFQLNQYWGKEFKAAYGALTRIVPEEKINKVPVTTECLKKAYEISPKCMELKEYFDNELKEWARCGDGGLDQIQGGYFHWALIRAVESKGYYKDAKTANEFYTEMAKEINDACDEGKVECLKYKRVSNVNRFDIEDICKTIKKCKDTIKYQYKMVLLNTKISQEYFFDSDAIYEQRMQEFEKITLTKTARNECYYNEPYKTGINILNQIMEIYKTINPYVFYESILVAIIFVMQSVIRNQKNGEKVILLIGLVGLYLCRIFIITFTYITMYTSAINVMYLSTTYIIQILFAIFANVFLGYEIIKKGKENGKCKTNNIITGIK